jgi:hypothetical protein
LQSRLHPLKYHHLQWQTKYRYYLPQAYLP